MLFQGKRIKKNTINLRSIDCAFFSSKKLSSKLNFANAKNNNIEYKSKKKCKCQYDKNLHAGPWKKRKQRKETRIATTNGQLSRLHFLLLHIIHTERQFNACYSYNSFFNILYVFQLQIPMYGTLIAVLAKAQCFYAWNVLYVATRLRCDVATYANNSFGLIKGLEML